MNQSAESAAEEYSTVSQHTLDGTFYEAVNENTKRDFLAGVQWRDKNPSDEVRALVECLKTTNYWLLRMSELRWDDPSYAPNFKKCWNENELVLSNYRQKIGAGK